MTILRKKLESSLGLLMWSTATCSHLRPYLAPLYRDLRSAKGSVKQIHAQQWLPFLDAHNNEAIVARQPLGVWLPLHARAINIGSTQQQSKADIPKVPPGRKAAWIRIADPRRTEIHLRDESKQAIAWLSACFSHDRIRSIRQKPALQCYAAADAMAKGEPFGIGGWLVTSSHCSWFSERYCMSEARALWPQLQDTAQRYIACFETLAQLALTMMVHRTCSARQWSFTLPSASDNAPTEAGLNKLWSTAEPLGSFFKLAAAWAARHGIQFMVRHIAGEKNSWADTLSRNRMRTFQDALGCIALHPPSAAWPDEILKAQHPNA